MRGILLPIIIILFIVFYPIVKYDSLIPVIENIWAPIFLLFVFFGFQMLFVSSITLEKDCVILKFPFPLSVFKVPKVFSFSTIEKLIFVKNTYGYAVEKFKIVLKDGTSKNFTYGFITIKSKDAMISRMRSIGLKIDFFHTTTKSRKT